MSSDVIGEISNNLETLELKISKKTKKVKIPDAPEFQDDMVIGKKYKFKGVACIWDGNNGWLCPDKLKYKDCKEERCIKKYKFLRFVLRFIPLIVIFCCELCKKRFGNNKEGEDGKLESDVWEDGEDACKECRESRLKDIKCTNGPRTVCENHNECLTCYNKSFMSNVKAKYWSLENTLTPRQVTKSSNQKFWFNCNNCPHKFDVKLSKISRKNGSWCPYCSHTKLCFDNKCYVCFKNSFDSHEKSQLWSDINKLKPRDIFKNCHTKFWFDCNCKHKYKARPADFSQNKRKGCPYCTNKKLCKDVECNMCFNNSFASSEKVYYWSNKNKDNRGFLINPRNVFKCSRLNIWFNCICGHEFKTVLDKIISGNNWCPYCAHIKLCDQDCKMCFNNSFASSLKLHLWSNKNQLIPRQIFKNSNYIFLFNCDKCFFEFKSRVADISDGHACPICKNKTEKLILEFLILSEFNPIHQYKVD
jgi:hypothetical protein